MMMTRRATETSLVLLVSSLARSLSRGSFSRAVKIKTYDAAGTVREKRTYNTEIEVGG